MSSYKYDWELIMDDKILKQLKENWNKMDENFGLIAALPALYANKSSLGKFLDKLFPDKEEKLKFKKLEQLIQERPKWKQGIKEFGEVVLQKFKSEKDALDNIEKLYDVRKNIPGDGSIYTIIRMVFKAPKLFNKLVS
jgi:hypothetical protein